MGNKKEGFIDVHSHIVFGVDDGAESFRTTKKMLQMAYQDGIRQIISTPHFLPGRREFDEETYQRSFKMAQEAAFKIDPAFQLHQGNEIYYHDQAAAYLQEGKIHTLADSQYILVEFNPIREFFYMRESLMELQARGYEVILAHAERMRTLSLVERVEELVDRGIYIQINADSVLGRNGHAVKQLTHQFLKENLVSFIASDSHDLSHRPPELRKCYRKVAKRFGEQTAYELMVENPQRVIDRRML